MTDCVHIGPVYGRPYGGVVILVRNDLINNTECICTNERYVIIRVGDLLIVNVYLPCDGTNDRALICSDILNDVLSWRSRFLDCSCIIGGDFNVNLDTNNAISVHINKFLVDNEFIRSDVATGCTCKFTYANEALQCFNKIDYFVCNRLKVDSFDVKDPDVNFSDHLPLLLTCTVQTDLAFYKADKRQNKRDSGYEPNVVLRLNCSQY